MRAAVHWVAPSNGGRGAARGAIEFILAAQGKLESAIEEYIRERSELSP